MTRYGFYVDTSGCTGPGHYRRATHACRCGRLCSHKCDLAQLLQNHCRCCLRRILHQQ